MKNKQLSILFITNFAVFFIGMGLLPLLPLYAAQFGATPTGSGLYLASTYTAIALGTVLTGWLSDKLSLRRLSVSAGLAGLPALVLLGQAAALWQVVVLTAVVWFCGGIGGVTCGQVVGWQGYPFMFAALGLVWASWPVAAVLGMEEPRPRADSPAPA